MYFRHPRLSVAIAVLAVSIDRAAPLAQGQVRTLTIADAVDEAIQHNLSLLAAQADLSIADAALVTARLRPNPVISGGGDSLDLLGTGFDEINQAGPPNYAVRVDVPVERGGKRFLRTDVAAYAKQVAAAQFADAVRHVKLDVTVAAVDVLESKARLQLARENLDALQRLVTLNTQRLTSGSIPPLEVTRSRVAMLQYRGNVRSAELAVVQARFKLLPLLGRTPGDATIDIDDRLGLAPIGAPLDLAELQRSARATRPDFAALQRDQARTEADLRLQIAQGKIDYTFGAEYRREQGVNGRGNTLGLFFSAPLPIFNRNQGEIARAEASRDKARRSLAALDADLSSEVASVCAEFESARQLLAEIETDLLKPSTDARTTVNYVYQAGASSLLEVLDAQRAFNETMETYYSAQAAYRRAAAKLALTVGKDVVP